jgi:hypothetical protein
MSLSSQPVDLESALDELFATPLDMFTSKRNMLTKQLKGSAAAAVKAVKKPNLAAWATNEVARKHPDEVAQLFSVTDKLRRAQRRVLSGGKANELRAATDERNKTVNRLGKLAEKILRDSGHGASAATLQGVADSFMAVASDPEGAELLRRGRLQRELEPSTVIDVGGGLTLVEDHEEATDRRSSSRGEASKLLEARRIVSELRGSVKEARGAFKEADRSAERLLRDAEEVERKAKAAGEEAEFARRAADARRAEAEEAEQRLKAAEAALSELEES